MQSDPFVASDIRRRGDPFPLRQFGKIFRAALERDPLRNAPQANHSEDLVADFEAKLVSPLQLLSRMWKRETKRPQGIQVHIFKPAAAPLRGSHPNPSFVFRDR